MRAQTIRRTLAGAGARTTAGIPGSAMSHSVLNCSRAAGVDPAVIVSIKREQLGWRRLSWSYLEQVLDRVRARLAILRRGSLSTHGWMERDECECECVLSSSLTRTSAVERTSAASSSASPAPRPFAPTPTAIASPANAPAPGVVAAAFAVADNDETDCCCCCRCSSGDGGAIVGTVIAGPKLRVVDRSSVSRVCVCVRRSKRARSVDR